MHFSAFIATVPQTCQVCCLLKEERETSTQAELGWRKLEEKVLFGRRMWELEDERLVKNTIVIEGSREEHEVLVSKYGFEEQDEKQDGSEWKRRVKEVNWK